MLYHAYEWTHSTIAPLRQVAEAGLKACNDPRNPWAGSLPLRTWAASLEMFETATKRYGRPEFDIDIIEAHGQPAAVRQEVVFEKPFCRLIHFRRYGEGCSEGKDPKVLLIAPLSGHFSTLLRGTVTKMLETHDVYLTDWRDARNVPVTEGLFDLEDYTEYLIEFLQHIGPGTSMMGVCQPGVAALAATALMAEDNDPCRPESLILMGSPIDTRVSPTEPTKLADEKSLQWFESNMISLVPLPNPGVMRRVYPGFLQLSGFMSMNIDRHLDAARKQFGNLVKGDGEADEAHRKFYDEYLAVMDLTAEFYLQTIDVVFQRHLLPKGEMTVRDRKVNLDAITDVPIMTVEGGRDDITGEGQTHITHTLTGGLSEDLKQAYTHPDVGHYGVFNGSRWRSTIQPKIAEFIAAHHK